MRRRDACLPLLLVLCAPALLGCAAAPPTPMAQAPKPAPAVVSMPDPRLLARQDQLEGRVSELRQQIQMLYDRLDNLRVEPASGVADSNALRAELATLRTEVARLRGLVQEHGGKLDSICVQTNNLGTRIIAPC